MYGRRTPLRLTRAGAGRTAFGPSHFFPVPAPYVGFAGQLPVPLYGDAARLPIAGAAARGWNLGDTPWSALIVPAELDEATLTLLCELLTSLDVNYLRAHPEAPDLYKSGVRYMLMPQTEYWLAIPWALAFARAGLGVDCKTLAAWRAAELRVRYGEPRARCVWTEHRGPTDLVYHVRVQRENGSIEDPSALLGMNSVLPSSPAQVGLWRP